VGSIAMVDSGHKNKRKSSYKHIYKTSIDNVEILRQRVEDGCREIRAIPGIFKKARQSMMRRVEACIQVRGSHFEHFLLP